jgi:hypothetical protein
MEEDMATPKRRYPKEEFARRGDAIYEKDVQPLLKPRDKGKYVAIDIETGDHEIAEERMEASENLRARLPDAQIWMMRIGFPTVIRLGGGHLTRKS